MRWRRSFATARRQRGAPELIAFMVGTITGIFATAPREHLAILHQDVRHTFRHGCAGSACYTALAIVILGASASERTRIVSVIHAICFAPLPYVHAGDLVLIRQLAPQARIPGCRFSVAEIADYARATNLFLSRRISQHGLHALGEGDGTRPHGCCVTRFLRIFGIKPLLGRASSGLTTRPERPPVLLMSYEYWQKRGADPHIVGRAFRMNTASTIVVGVLPPYPNIRRERCFMPTGRVPLSIRPTIVANRSGPNDAGVRTMKPALCRKPPPI